MLVVNSLCKNIFLIFFSKFPVFSLSGKIDFQIPCFPCAVATLPLNWTCPPNGVTVKHRLYYICNNIVSILCVCITITNFDVNINANRELIPTGFLIRSMQLKWLHKKQYFGCENVKCKGPFTWSEGECNSDVASRWVLRKFNVLYT